MHTGGCCVIQDCVPVFRARVLLPEACAPVLQVISGVVGLFQVDRTRPTVLAGSHMFHYVSWSGCSMNSSRKRGDSLLLRVLAAPTPKTKIKEAAPPSGGAAPLGRLPVLQGSGETQLPGFHAPLSSGDFVHTPKILWPFSPGAHGWLEVVFVGVLR